MLIWAAVILGLLYAMWYGTDWLELAMAFAFGWFGGKAHGCCLTCKWTSGCTEDWRNIDAM
jgi:uncharacterized membrane protein YbjE (DUF340 family)